MLLFICQYSDTQHTHILKTKSLKYNKVCDGGLTLLDTLYIIFIVNGGLKSMTPLVGHSFGPQMIRITRHTHNTITTDHRRIA